MHKIIAIASAIGLCVGCAPRVGRNAPTPAVASAKSCAKTAKLLDAREGILDDMHLKPEERARLSIGAIRSTEPLPGHGQSAGQLAYQSLGAAQGIISTSERARGYSAGSNYEYYHLTATTGPRYFLSLRLRSVDDRLRRLPSAEACADAGLFPSTDAQR